MATHSGILAWKIPWTEEPGGLQFMGSQRVGHDWACLNNIHVQVCVWTCISFSCVKCLGIKSYSSCIPKFLRNCKLPQSGFIQYKFAFLAAVYESSSCCTTFLTCGMVSHFRHSNVYVVVSYCGFSLHLPTDRWYWTFKNKYICHLCSYLKRFTLLSWLHGMEALRTGNWDSSGAHLFCFPSLRYHLCALSGRPLFHVCLVFSRRGVILVSATPMLAKSTHMNFNI